jgi:sulfite exporter TauE/SafE
VLLGAIAGGVGAKVNDLGRLAGVGRGAAIVAGILMIVWAADRIGVSFGVRSRLARAPERMQRMMGRVLLMGRDAGETTRALLVGLVTTLLPCGWLYTFVVVAGSTGSALSGVAVMVVFWIGTVPMLVAVSAGAARLLGPFARRLPLASAVAVLALGVLSIAGKLRAPSDGAHLAHAAHATHATYVRR